jgi:hypothetical protein
MADKPNQAEVEQLVTGIMRPYNDALAQVVKDARG